MVPWDTNPAVAVSVLAPCEPVPDAGVVERISLRRDLPTVAKLPRTRYRGLDLVAPRDAGRQQHEVDQFADDILPPHLAPLGGEKSDC